jgi:hypothetical protein
MIFQKPDGAIELGFSGCCCPPGERRKGMHTNACTSWFRVKDGKWPRDLNPTNTRILAEAALSTADFLSARQPTKEQNK